MMLKITNIPGKAFRKNLSILKWDILAEFLVGLRQKVMFTRNFQKKGEFSEALVLF